MLHAHHDLPRPGPGQGTFSDRSALKIRNGREGAVKHMFSEADLMQARLERIKVNAHGRNAHSRANM